MVKPDNNGAHFEFVVDATTTKTLSEARSSTNLHSKLRSLVTFKSLVSLHGAYHKKPSPTAECAPSTFLSGIISHNI